MGDVVHGYGAVIEIPELTEPTDFIPQTTEREPYTIELKYKYVWRNQDVFHALYYYLNPSLYRPGSDRTKRLRKKKYTALYPNDPIMAKIASRRATGKAW